MLDDGGRLEVCGNTFSRYDQDGALIANNDLWDSRAEKHVEPDPGMFPVRSKFAHCCPLSAELIAARKNLDDECPACVALMDESNYQLNCL